MYKIENFQEFLVCTTSGYPDPEDRDDPSWVEGEYFSFYPCGDCRFAYGNHPLPVTLDIRGNENFTSLGQRGGVLAKGNNIHYEINIHFEPSHGEDRQGYRSTDIIKCDDQLMINFGNEDFETPASCLAKAIFLSPDYYPYEHFEDICSR
ncbi:MAG TPA: hypothetical protein VJI15_04350 [Candidatus Nanoarchaeia archaeon]|nr:hypothetical protein [Candidatus Nanoarchaeia archaeon]